MTAINHPISNPISSAAQEKKSKVGVYKNHIED